MSARTLRGTVLSAKEGRKYTRGHSLKDSTSILCLGQEKNDILDLILNVIY